MSPLVCPILVSLLGVPQDDRFDELRITHSNSAPFGHSLAMQDERLLIGSARSDQWGGDAGAANVYKRKGTTGYDPRWAHRDILSPHETNSPTALGASMSADGPWLAVGAPEWSDLDDAGRVVLFRWKQRSWHLEQVLPSASDGFGRVVALDRSRLVVRGDSEWNENTEVWSYEEQGGVWSFDHPVHPPAGDSADGFGWAMALQDDLAIVSAPGYDHVNEPDAGVVWLFAHTPQGWTDVAMLTSPDPTATEEFGYSVAIHGDLIAVGAPGDHQDDRAGRVYTYRETSPGTWVHESTFTGADPNHRGRFGEDVAVHFGQVLIGAHEEIATNGRGRVYVASSGTLTPIEPTTALHVASFGSEVALRGNSIAVSSLSFDLDEQAVWTFGFAAGSWVQTSEYVAARDEAGFGEELVFAAEELVIAVPHADRTPIRLGKLKGYQEIGLRWIPSGEITLPNEREGDLYGTAVAYEDDWVAIGAPGDDSRLGTTPVLEESGSVTIYKVRNIKQKIAPDFLQSGDRFGTSVAMHQARLLVGAPGHDALGPDTGAVWRFFRNGNKYEVSEAFYPDPAFPTLEYGASIANSLEIMAIGAPGSPGPLGPDQGAVYVYRRTPWTLEAILQPESLNVGARFGTSLSFENGVLAVGAPGSDLGGTQAGAVYLFRDSPDGWIHEPGFTAPGGADGDGFGTSIDMIDGRIAVGAPGFDLGADNCGAMFLFTDCGIGYPQLRARTSEPQPDLAMGSAVLLAPWLHLAITTAPGDRRVDQRIGSVTSFEAFGSDFEAPSLVADGESISTAGGSLHLGMNPGIYKRMYRYFLVGSLSGTDGFRHDGYYIPLTIDSYFMLTATMPDAAFLTPSVGKFSYDGRATSTFTTPPLPSGLQFHHAYVIYNNNTGDLKFASNAVLTEIR